MQTRAQVLIADDSDCSRNGLKALLSTWPEVEVVGEAADGEAAVRLTEQLHPDVVLMDAKMPRLDGVAATRIIKDKWPNVRVVILTVYSSFRRDAMAARADAFLVKGNLAEELRSTILTS